MDDKAFLAVENCLSVSILYCFPCSRKKPKQNKTKQNKKLLMLVNSEVSLLGSNSIVSVLLNYVLLKQSELKACPVFVVVSRPVV